MSIIFGLLVTCMLYTYTNAGPIMSERQTIKSHYNCDHPGIMNRTECEIIMSNAILSQSRHRLLRFSEGALRLAKSRPARSAHLSYGQPGCDFPENYLGTHTAPEDRSLSPWTKVVTNDEKRIPSYIEQSTCKCKGCINPRTMTESKSLNSVPIKVLVTVYRLQPDNTYSKKQELISVGCTCVIPKHI